MYCASNLGHIVQSLHRKDWNFLGGGRFCKTKKIKEMYGVQSEFPEGWGEKFPSVGEVWIFSGTTHYVDLMILDIW